MLKRKTYPPVHHERWKAAMHNQGYLKSGGREGGLHVRRQNLSDTWSVLLREAIRSKAH